MHEFLQRYANNDYSEDEHQQFIDWLRSAPLPEVEAVAEQYRLIAETKMPGPTSHRQLVDKIESALDKLTPTPVMPLYQRTWFRAAAVLLILLSGIAAYYSIVKSKSNGLAVQQANRTVDVSPGDNKAVLVMGDGSEVLLNDSANIVLEEKNGQEIFNTDGSLSYPAGGAVEGGLIYNLVKVPRSGQYRLKLSDGTRVWLNSESSLYYPTTFGGEERNVKVTGEAYFEVAKDAKRKFTVSGGGLTTEVLGTHFNINTYANEEAVKVTLLEGSVKVATADNNRGAVLKPGGQAMLKLNSRITIRENVDVEEVVAWKEGRFQFKDASLKAIMRQLIRWYDIEVEYVGSIDDRLFTANISRTKNLSSVVKILEMNNIHCRIEGNKLIVKP